jgi:hypothetical protein
MKTYYTIYKITNQVDGKIYIGSHKTKDLNDSYMGSGKYLKYAQEKYGIENFEKEILFAFETPEEMYLKEAELVNEEFIATENTYNLKVGGFGGWDYLNSSKKNLYGSNGKLGYGGENLEKGRDRVRTLEEFDKISKTLKEGYSSGRITPPFLGKRHTEETLNKLKGHDRQNGERNSQYGTRWIHSKSLQVSKRINKNDPLPVGWEEGRKIKFI